MLRLSLLLKLILIGLFGLRHYGPIKVSSQVPTTSTPNSIINLTTTTEFNLQKQEDPLRVNKSKDMLNYMNLSADPCEDFYEYACGNWNKYHTIEDESLDTLLENKINKDLHLLLDENATVEDSTAARKVKVFYKSCMETRRNDEQHQIFLKDFIKSNGGFPAAPGSNWLVQNHNYNWQHIVAGLRYHYGLDILIGMDIDVNYQNEHENSIYLMEPSTLIPRHLCNQRETQRTEVTEHVYDAVEQGVADNLKLWLSLAPEESLKLAADIVTFEYDLCKAMYVNETLEEENFHLKTLTENIHGKYSRKSLLEFNHMYNNSIDFNGIVRDSFGIPINKPVFMKSPAYFEQLIKVVEEYNDYNRMVVANYIMYRAMTYINLPLTDAPQNRSAYCLQVVKKYFPKILGEIYHRHYSNTLDEERVHDIFDKLKDQFRKSLRQKWIEPSTANVGLSKLTELQLQMYSYEKINFNLDFERGDYWKNLKLIMSQVRAQDLTRIFATSLTAPKDEVEAFETRIVYRPYHKRIDMGLGILQAPYYDSQLPNAMRFAALGQKMAQALAIAYDDSNWMFDIRGHNNWDPQTAMEFFKRANCYREQVGNYLNNQPLSFKQPLKIRQLIAKGSGLNLAFNAYIDWLHYQHPVNDLVNLYRETLANFDFSNTQLFFITFAQMHCRSTPQKLKKSESRRIISPLTQHDMLRYEVNGPLTNFQEFAREFHCLLGSEMSAADKCVIY